MPPAGGFPCGFPVFGFVPPACAEASPPAGGFFSSLPLGIILVGSFLAPLVVVALFSIMPQKVFTLGQFPDFSSYGLFFDQGYYKSLLWSLSMALASTIILFFVCWPLAYGMAKVFGKFTLVLTIAVVNLHSYLMQQIQQKYLVVLLEL